MDNREFAIIGDNIRKLRKARNFTQETFAEKLQISTNHVHRIENAETHISLPLLIKIKELLNVDGNALLEQQKDEAKCYFRQDDRLSDQQITERVEYLIRDCNDREKEILLRTLYQLHDILKSLR